MKLSELVVSRKADLGITSKRRLTTVINTIEDGLKAGELKATFGGFTTKNVLLASIGLAPYAVTNEAGTANQVDWDVEDIDLLIQMTQERTDSGGVPKGRAVPYAQRGADTMMPFFFSLDALVKNYLANKGKKVDPQLVKDFLDIYHLSQPTVLRSPPIEAEGWEGPTELPEGYTLGAKATQEKGTGYIIPVKN